MHYRNILASSLLFVGSALAQSSASASSTKKPEDSPSTTGSAATATVSTTVHVVMVGANNGLVFQPSNIQAAPGSMIEFQFTSRNHSVVQADFAHPCVPIEQVSSEYAGFYSGFMPIAAGSNTMPKFTIMVPDTEPIYYYCSQGEHCQAGMVGAINA
ncbi:hypothetical protein LTR04_001417 [Oleoguttula sp. CCFEE 6159]|nr:hypothetical protein LTR04_001417 [Oleoguttula sp. CCFEE 6159]